jgi:hypothetical protein
MADFYITSLVGPFASVVGSAFGTFTTRQDVSPQPVPVLNPNTLHIGSKLKIEAEGEFSSTGTPTFVMGVYLGTNAAPPAPVSILAESAAQATSTAASWPWRLEYRGIVTALGTAGSITGMGNLEWSTSLTASTTVPMPLTLALRTVAIDTTIVRSIGVCATCSASNAANTIKTYNLSVQLMN